MKKKTRKDISLQQNKWHLVMVTPLISLEVYSCCFANLLHQLTTSLHHLGHLANQEDVLPFPHCDLCRTWIVYCLPNRSTTGNMQHLFCQSHRSPAPKKQTKL
ncbi:hypothetical protein TNCT_527691 [Trichonephila clavata]|uniref:Uncharacterized protein n=1 Tax=Trichonephila clavata TaxID=2740835 RepID=A0A8X6KYA2_TRICU|nr:hypothetical protein TNCT_527691 [Trichonephila clavata]